MNTEKGHIIRGHEGMAAILLLFITLLVLLGVITAADFGYIAYAKDRFIAPTATPVPGQPFTPVVARGTFSKDAYSVAVSLTFPLEGGPVSGTFSGDCSGDLTGYYDGAGAGTISGSAYGSCDPLVVPIPASATFTGTVNPSGRTVPITAQGSAAGFSGFGSLVLTY